MRASASCWGHLGSWPPPRGFGRSYLHHQASFITTFYQQANPNLKPVEDFNFFPFPDINPDYAGAEEATGDLFGMIKDSPPARDLVRYLATAQAQAI